MAITVEILPTAQRMLDAADDRWIDEHGPNTDNPMLDQVTEASDRLRGNPNIGKIVRRGTVAIHRLLLPSGWHLYYRYRVDCQRVEIVAVWWSTRANEPRL